MSNYPSDMDHSCIELCDAINLIPGIRTSCSCCGHGKSRFSVGLVLTNLKITSLYPLMRHIWGTTLEGGSRTDPAIPCWDMGISFEADHYYQEKRTEKVFLTLYGPVGQEGYESSRKLAALIRADSTKSGGK